jgi:hypothetical protein
MSPFVVRKDWTIELKWRKLNKELLLLIYHEFEAICLKTIVISFIDIKIDLSRINSTIKRT